MSADYHSVVIDFNAILDPLLAGAFEIAETQHKYICISVNFFGDN